MLPAPQGSRRAKPRRCAHAPASWAVLTWLLLGLVAALLLLQQPAAALDEVDGSVSASLLPPHAIEELFASTISAESARANLKRLTSVPHQAGSVGDFELAKVRRPLLVLALRM